MEIDDLNIPEAPKESPGDAAPAEARTNNEAPSIEEIATDIATENQSDDNPPAVETVQTSAQDENWADIVHGCKWYNYNDADNIALNGKVPHNKWGIRLHSGEVLYQNGDVQQMYSPLDYFMMSFPDKQMQLCLNETNKQLRKNRKRETNKTELYIKYLDSWC